MDSKTTVHVVKRLVGVVNPIGQSSADLVRFENLRHLTEVTEELLEIIKHVHTSNQHSHEHSVKRASNHAGEFLERIKQEI
jgi:hypothetical protein